MKVFIVLCALIVAAYSASVADVYEGDTYDSEDRLIQDAYDPDDELVKTLAAVEPQDELDATQGHRRVRRFACDVLSFKSKWLSPNHSACAVRCLAQRRRGGKCVNGICKCRGKKWGK